MTAKIIDGNALAQTVRAELAEKAAALKATQGITPCLAVILAGVHHIDRDRSNNDISNLALLTPQEHFGLDEVVGGEHGRDIAGRGKLAIQLAIEKAPEWHRSDAGRAWHRAHHRRMSDKLYVRSSRTCHHCGREHETSRKGGTSFCSNGCKSAHRRASGVDSVRRDCVICGGAFDANKYSRVKTCSRACGSIASGNARRSPALP